GHNVAAQGLISDPLKRKVIRTTGENPVTEVIKLCGACYQKAFRIKKRNKANESSDVGKEIEQIADKPIKKEFDAGDEECSISKVSRIQHKINNHLPILQDPKAPNRSLLSEAEGPHSTQSIRCLNWNVFSHLKPSEKNQIKKEVSEWLQLNENDRDAYAKKLEELFEVIIPIDEGPSRGQSVFAKQDIKQYQVVCPYAGVLHEDEASLEASIRKNGSISILSYLFGTSSSQRAVDAYRTGNVASFVNTSQLGDEPAFKENNLVPLLFGKNLIFYIALRDIKKGEELFLSYGDNYNPFQRVKQEPIEDNPDVGSL
ncbi:MAG: SET domain-containing protein-lysine N-methyltransferase, partial [Chlamydiota bacterium]